MSKAKAQPAYKSYFFDQGFKDIIIAIKNSWLENTSTALRYYTNYRARGILSFTGFINLFSVFAVLSFGTLFFLIISAIILAIVCVVYVLGYIGFSIIWLVDRAYLHIRKISTACYECKTKSLIPTYICPDCGREHTDLTPGVYGVFKRKCLCGRKLPSTFFMGRKKLPAKCPHCGVSLSDRESRPFCIPIVGGRSSGKTAYITAFSKVFIDDIAKRKNLDIEIYNSEKEKIFNEIQNDYKFGSTRMTARAHDLGATSAVSFSFFVKNKKLKPERLVHIYDIAGEVFTQNSENEIQKQYDYCQGIVFVVDPFAIPLVRYKYENKLNQVDLAGIGRADLNGIIDNFLNKLRLVTGLADSQMSKVPLAVVIGKIDSAGLDENFSEEKIQKLIKANPGLNYYDAMDYLARKFLSDMEMTSFLKTIDLSFKTNRYFVASAIGHSRDDGTYDPYGVVEPIEWIASIADRDLAETFAEKNIPQKRSTSIRESEVNL